jgi:hypothetical protein
MYEKKVDRLCGLVVRVPGYRTELYCAFCEVRTEFWVFLWQSLVTELYLREHCPSISCIELPKFREKWVLLNETSYLIANDILCRVFHKKQQYRYVWVSMNEMLCIRTAVKVQFLYKRAKRVSAVRSHKVVWLQSQEKVFREQPVTVPTSEENLSAAEFARKCSHHTERNGLVMNCGSFGIRK